MRAAQKLRSRRRGLERRPHRRAQRVDLRSDRLLPEAHRLSGDPQALLGFLEDAVASERISPADLLMMERLIGDSQLGRALDPSFEARAAEITGAEPGSARLVEGLPNFVRAEGARALAAGSTIAVAPGQARNEALLAHELTHVSQHSAGGPQLHFDSGAGGAARAEVEANRAGEKVERQQGVQAKPEKQQIDPKTRAQLERLSRVSSAEVAAMRRDVEKIAGVLMEWHISDAEEQKMLAPFHRWLVRDNKRNAQLRELADKGIHPERRVSRTMYLDRLVLQCRMKTLNKGSARTMGMKFARSVFDDLFFELTEQNLLSYKNYLRLSETGRRDVERPPKPPPNIWKEVVGKTVNDLPAGITSATGGALQSLPFGVGDSAGEFLKERADDYMASGGIAALAGAEGMESSEELREEVIAGTSLVGRVGGEVGQVVAGGAILKAATAPGKVAKAADTLNKANKARRATQAAKVV